MKFSRRQFISSGLLSALGLFVLDSFWFEKAFIETNEFHLGDNKDQNKATFVQISDLHLQAVGTPLQTVARDINQLEPDLLFITGDSVDRFDNIHLLQNFLSYVDRNIKKVAILGNWEIWGKVDIKKLKDIYADNNGDLLINESKQYLAGGKRVSVTGVDDFLGGQADIALALEKYIPGDHHIVLCHCPEYTDTIANYCKGKIPIDFMLSGHTHGGQLNFFGYVPFTPPGSGRYVKGWYRDENKNLYVSKGIGTTRIPARFMCRSEITVFHV